MNHALSYILQFKNTFFCYLAFILILFPAISSGQTLNVISNNLTNGELLTGSEFSLEAVIQVPAGCTYATAELVLPQDVYIDTQNPINDANWQCISCSGSTILIESKPGAFDNAGGTNGGDGISLQVNLELDMGPVCEGVLFEFEYDLNYYTDTMTPCGSQTTSTASFTSKYAEDYWQVTIEKETDDIYMCVGGYTKYKVTIPSMDDPGGYDVADALIGFIPIGEIFKVFDENYNEIPFDYFCFQFFGGIICVDDCTPYIFIPTSLNVYSSTKTFYVIVNYDCSGCDYEANYRDPTAVINVKPPCQTEYINTDLASTSFDPTIFSTNPTCCGSYVGPVNLIKNHNTFGPENVCPGACNSTSYIIQYDNTQSAVDQVNFCITDELPDHYDISNFNFAGSDDTYFDGVNTATVTFSNGGLSQSFTIGGGGINPNGFSLSANGVGFQPDMFEICFDQNVLAFAHYIDINYQGKFNANNVVGDIITVCATTNTGLLACETNTVAACSPDISGFLQAQKSGVAATNSLSVNRGEKATIRINVRNLGTANLDNANLQMVLPPDFSYCSATEEYYYTNNINSATPSPTPHPDVGGTLSVSGQNVNFNGFDLEKRCTSNRDLYIFFDVLVAPNALAGPNLFNFTVNGNSIGSMNITVNTFYQVEAKTLISCTSPGCMDVLGTIALDSPGQEVWYKYEVTNKGNVPISNISIFNNSPNVGALASDCVGTARPGDLNLDYSTPSSYSICGLSNFTSEFSSSACPASYGPSYSASSASAKFFSPDVLMPGDSYSVIVKYDIPPGASAGNFAYNDFAFTAERDDIPGTTDLLLSNAAELYITPNTCGIVNDPSDVDCNSVGLNMISTSVPSVSTCCVEISIDGNLYPDILNGIHIDVPGGELITYSDIDPGFSIGSGGNNQSMFLVPNGSSHLPLGSYPVATLCIDPLYASTQTINAAIELDAFNSFPVQNICESSFNLNCTPTATPDYWTKFYNNGDDNFGRQIKVFGNYIYVLGYINATQPYYPTMSKFDLNGNLIWHKEYHSTLNSLLTDFQVSQDQSRIVATGLTYPYNFNNTFLVSIIDTNDGSLINTSQYNNMNRDIGRRVLVHQNPEDPNFPIYVAGQYNGAADTPILINMDKNGNINWTKIYYDISVSSDNQFNTSLIGLDDGNIILAGDNIQEGLLLKVNGLDGSVVTAKEDLLGGWAISSEGFDFGNGIAIAGREVTTNEGFVVLFDYDLEYIDGIKFPNLSTINSLSTAINDTIYAISNSTVADDYPVLLRLYIDESGSTPDLVYVDAHKLEQTNTDYSGSHLSTSQFDALYFVSSQLDASNDWTIYLGTIPLDMNSNCIESTTEFVLTYTMDMTNITITDQAYTLPTPVLYSTDSDLDYVCTNVCEPGCIANFNYTETAPTNDCGLIINFNNISTSTAGPYDWDFGDGTTATNTDNPTHLYEAPGIYYVCLYDTQCDDYYCQYVEVDFDSSLPTLSCSSTLPVCNDPGQCSAFVTIPDIGFLGGNLLCANKLKRERSDGLSLSAPYDIGTTYITNTYDNDFGETDTCVQIVTVLDCEAPVISCPVDQTVSTTSYAGAFVNWIEPTATDLCSDSVTITQNYYSGDFMPCGTTIVTSTASDGSNQSSCSFSVTVDCPTCNNTAMDFDGVNDNVQMLSTTAASDFTIGAWILPDATSNGGDADIVYSFGPTKRLEVGIDENSGDLHVYDEGALNTYTSNAVDLRDGCWHHIAITRKDDDIAVYVDFGFATAWTSTFIDYGLNFHVGSWAGGNTNNTEFAGLIDEVRGYDVAYPSPAIQSVFSTIPATATPNLRIYFDFEDGIPEHDNTSMTATMNQGDLIDGTLLGFALQGTNSNFVCEEIDLSFSCNPDPCDNDIAAPICVTQDVTVSLDSDGVANIDYTMIDDGSTDDCGIVLYQLSQSNFDCSDIGTNALFMNVYDAADNPSQCGFNVTVIDDLAPICNATDIVVSLDQNGIACIDSSFFEPVCMVSAVCVKLFINVQPVDTNLDGIVDAFYGIVEADDMDGGSTSSCGFDLTYSFSADLNDNILFLDCTSLGMTNVDLWVTDEQGNQAICTGIVYLQDPNDFCGSSFTEEEDEEDVNRKLEIFQKQMMSTSMAYQDNCGVTSVNISTSKFACNDIGNNPVTLTVTDASGNSTVCVVNVEIQDKLGPMCITQNVTLELDTTGQAYLSPLSVDFGSIDNCGNLYYELDKTNFNCDDTGMHVVILTVTDDAGNFTTNTATVNVIDRYGACCPDHLIINDNPIECGTYFAHDSITSDGFIENLEFVTFDAPGILLLSNFEAELGSTFETKLIGCEELPMDGDGNQYGIVEIGNQTWMAQNLRTTKYSDGTDIPFEPSNADWTNANSSNSPAYAWYDGEISNAAPLGALYNWHAVSSSTNGGKNVCPNGWHVPSLAEYEELVQHFDAGSTNGNSPFAGSALKSFGTIEAYNGNWLSPNGGNNSSYFSGVPGGLRISNSGNYNGKGQFGRLWTSTNTGSNAFTFGLTNSSNASSTNGFNQGVGACIRCIKD